jgi:hypothetical protein
MIIVEIEKDDAVGGGGLRFLLVGFEPSTGRRCD